MPDFLVRLAADWNPLVTSTRQAIQQIVAESRKLDRLSPTDRAKELTRGQAAYNSAIDRAQTGGQLSTRDAARAKTVIGDQFAAQRTDAAAAMVDERTARAKETEAIKRSTAERLRLDQDYQRDATERRAATTSRIAAEKLGARGQVAGVTRDTGEDDIAYQARIVSAERLTKERQRLASATALADVSEEQLVLEAQSRLTERARAKALNDAQSKLIQQQIASGQRSAGTPVQRLQSYISGRQGGTPRAPDEYLTGPQLLSSRLLTTASFAVSGAATYAAFSGIQQMLKQATDLQLVMANLKSALEATDQAGDFPKMRKAILDISKETGAAAPDVAQVALQMKGAFEDTATAIDATTAAIKIMRVTGIDAATVVNDTVAVAKSFNTTIEHASDLALVMQDRYGTMAKEVLNAMAVLAPVAQQVGLTIQQTAALVASTGQVSGQSASTTAGQFNKILPALGEQAVGILQILKSVPSLAGQAPGLASDFTTGDYGKVLVQLIADSKDFNATQQEMILNLVGGRREAQALAAAFQEPDKVIQAMNGNLGEAGRTTKSFDAIQGTLSQQLAQLRREFEQIGEALLRLGIANAMHDIVVAGGGLLALIVGLARGLAELNEFTHGWAGRLVEVAVALRLVSTLAAGIGGGALGGAGGAGGVGGAAGVAGLGAGVLGKILTIGRPSGSHFVGSAVKTAAAGAGEEEAGGGLLAGLLGSGAGIGGTAVTGVGLGIVAAAAAGIAYASWRSAADKQANALKEKLQGLDDQALKEVAKTRAGFWTSVGAYFTGNVTSDTAAKGVLNATAGKGTTDQFAAAAQAGLFKSLPPSVVADAVRAADVTNTYGIGGSGTVVGEPGGAAGLSDKDVARLSAGAGAGDVRAIALQQRLLGQVDPAAVAAAVKKYQAKLKTVDAQKAVDTGQTVETSQSLKSGYSAGLISYDAYIKSLNDILDIYKSLGPGLSAQHRDEMVGIQNDIATAIVDATQRQLKFAETIANGDPIKIAKANLDSANSTLGDLRSKGLTNTEQYKDAQIAQLQAQQNSTKAAADVAAARIALKKQQDAKDPVASAKDDQSGADQALSTAHGDAAILAAQAQRAAADQSLTDANNEIATAKIGLLKAQHSGDAVKQAQDDQAAATQAANEAVGDAADLQAQAQQVTADQAYQNAVRDVAKSKIDLLKAMRAAAGDAVGVAQLAVQQAQTELDNAISDGKGEAELNQLRANLESAKSDQLQTTVSTAEDQVARDLDLQRITVAQAVAKLRALEITAPDQKTRDELESKARDLLKSAQQASDLRTSDFDFPTLYSVRRYSSETTQGGFVDNRQFDIKLYVTNGMTQDQAKQMLSDTLSTSAGVYGASPRIY